MKRNGREESTIKSTGYKLRFVAKNVNINNPELVKDFIINYQCSVTNKKQLVSVYNGYTIKYH
jgi:hypothetical protein